MERVIDVRGIGSDLIHRERIRQIYSEGWDAQHDDEHTEGQLAQAARAYCLAAILEVTISAKSSDLRTIPNDFPADWSREWWKPSDDPVRNLVKAGAMIAAEIDRLLRKKSGAEMTTSTDNPRVKKVMSRHEALQFACWLMATCGKSPETAERIVSAAYDAGYFDAWAGDIKIVKGPCEGGSGDRGRN